MNRKQAPSIHPITHISFQEPEISVLENQVEMYTLRETNDRTVRVDFVFNAGTLQASRVLAVLAGDLLLSGTSTKTSDEIEESIDYLGGYTEIATNHERTRVTMYGLIEYIEELSKILVDAIVNVNFNAKEIKQLIQEQRKRFKIQLQKVSVQARRTFIQEVFKNSPYGDQANLEDFDSITQEDLIQFHQKHYLNGLQYISIVGDLNEKQIDTIKTLGNQFQKGEDTPTDFNYEYSPTSLHIEKENAVQTAIRIGRILFNKKHPDYTKFLVVETILGGYFGSRLMTSIREEKGYTYGIGSDIVQYPNIGYFFIGSEVAKEYKDLTIQAIKEEIELLQTEEVDEEELSLVQSYLIGVILEQTDGAQAMMERFISVNTFGMKLSYFDELIKAIHEITPKEIKELAQRYLKWEDLVIVTAG